MSGQRLRLITSRPAGYRRGGQVIGGAAAPTFVERDGITVGQLLAVFLDPNITLAFETDDGRFETVTAEEREKTIDQLKQVIEEDGPDRTLGIVPAGDAGHEPTPEPTAQDAPAAPEPAPEPAAEPAPTPPARGKAKGSQA